MPRMEHRNAGDRVTWSAPLFFHSTGAGLGATVGYHEVNSLVLLDTQRAVEAMTKSSVRSLRFCKHTQFVTKLAGFKFQTGLSQVPAESNMVCFQNPADRFSIYRCPDYPARSVHASHQITTESFCWCSSCSHDHCPGNVSMLGQGFSGRERTAA